MDCVKMDTVGTLTLREDQSIPLSEKSRLPNKIYSVISFL